MRPARRALIAAGSLTLVLITVLGAVVLSTIWAPDRPVSALADRWAPPPSRFLSVADVGGAPSDGSVQVHLRDEGLQADSVPLVLLHGTSASLHTWDGWAQRLGATERVIRMDLPGFGLTGPAPSGAYSVQQYAQFTLALLDSLAVHQFVVAGNSMGGEVAWQVARAAPERVAALVLVDAAGYPTRSTSEPIGFRLARLPGFAWLMERMLPRSVIRSSLESAYGDPDRVSDSLVDRYYELTLRAGNRAAMRARVASPRTVGDTLVLQRLTVPTLILWGERDGVIPVSVARRFARDIPGSRLLLYPELGHVPHEEAPARTAADVAAFLTPR